MMDFLQLPIFPNNQSGLDFLKRWVGAEENLPGLQNLIGFRLERVELGKVRLALEPGLEHQNVMGIMHGGTIVSLMDTACGFSVISMLEPGQAFTSLDIKTSFLRPVKQSCARIVSDGWVVKRGKNIVFTESVLLDSEEKTLATCSSTCMILPQKSGKK